jgi:hypothetical protein
MPVYQVDIEKTMVLSTGNTYYWTNSYHVVAADQATATGHGNSIVTLEKTVHAANQTFTKMRVRNVSVLGMSPTIVVLSGNGGRSTPADVLPAYCTLRVDFGKAVGRPCRKFLRINLGESEQANGIITGGMIASTLAAYVTPLVTLGVVSDSDGDIITSGTILAPVQMRQLRRGSKRKVGPVI